MVQNDYASNNHLDTNAVVRYSNKYKGNENTAFKNFATKLFGNIMYQRFVVDSGFLDSENEDVNEVLNHYGLEDNQSGWAAIKLLWVT